MIEIESNLYRFVYFIAESHCYTMKGRSAVKIGVASNPTSRLKQLQTGNPKELELVLTIGPMSEKQSFRLERAFHKKFKKARVNGEWFLKKVLRYLEDMDGFPVVGEVRSYPTRAGLHGLYNGKLINEERDQLRQFEMEILANAKAAGL